MRINKNGTNIEILGIINPNPLNIKDKTTSFICEMQQS